MRRALLLTAVLGVLGTLACGPRGKVVAVPAPVPQASIPPPAPPKNSAQPEVVALGTVEGILRQVGNAPHIDVVVSGFSAEFGKGDYFLVGPRAEEIAQLPLGPIKVTGRLRRMALRLAGKSGKTRIRMDVDVSDYTR